METEVGIDSLEVGGAHVQPPHQAFDHGPAGATAKQVGEIVTRDRRKAPTTITQPKPKVPRWAS